MTDTQKDAILNHFITQADKALREELPTHNFHYYKQNIWSHLDPTHTCKSFCIIDYYITTLLGEQIHHDDATECLFILDTTDGTYETEFLTDEEKYNDIY